MAKKTDKEVKVFPNGSVVSIEKVVKGKRVSKVSYDVNGNVVEKPVKIKWNPSPGLKVPADAIVVETSKK